MEIQELAHQQKIYMSGIDSLWPQASSQQKEKECYPSQNPAPCSYVGFSYQHRNPSKGFTVSPVSSHQGCYKWIDCPFLARIIMLLCVSKLTSMHMHKYYPNHKEYQNGTVNTTSSTDYAQGSFKPELFCPFSSPDQSSLDFLMDTCGLYHLSCVAKAIRQGISPNPLQQKCPISWLNARRRMLKGRE
jgi:hypothetical protein